MRTILLLPLLALLPACASIVEGTDQQITVSSKPSEALCELIREGGQIGIVNPTPGTITVSKSAQDITVKCMKEGWGEGVQVLSADFESMTWGNAIFGGIIGLAVDAGSGAMHLYQPSVMVVLPPLEE